MSEYTLFLSLEQSTLSLETSLLQKDIFQLLTINQTIVQDNIKDVKKALRHKPNVKKLLKSTGNEKYKLAEEAIAPIENIENSISALINCFNVKTEDGITLAELINKERFSLDDNRVNLQTEVENLEREIRSLSQEKQVRYPPDVTKAISILENELRGSEPRVVCQYIEVLEPKWQNAIEGYLGGARFNIVVDPIFEADAAKLVTQKYRLKAKVVQGSLAKKHADKTVPDNSILSILEFSNAYVKDYITAQFGRVELVDSLEELRQTPRGITVKGTGSGGYTMYRCFTEDERLVLGDAAIERSIKAKTKKLNTLKSQFDECCNAFQAISNLHDALNQIQITSLSESLKTQVNSNSDIKHKQKLLRQLDTTSIEKILKEIELISKELSGKNLEKEESLKKEISKNETIKRNKDDLNKLERIISDGEDKLIKSETELLDFSEKIGNTDADTLLNKAEDIIKTESFTNENIDIELKNIENEWARLDEKMHTAIERYNEHHVRQLIVEFHRTSFQTNTLAYFSYVLSLQKNVDHIYNLIKNDKLVNVRDKLKEAQNKFNDTFVRDVIAQVFADIKNAERDITKLNKDMENHTFGDSTYKLVHEKEKEYKDYESCFREIDQLASLSAGKELPLDQLSVKSKKIYDEIQAFLLSDDWENAHKTLVRITDYRNYRCFDILKFNENRDPISIGKDATGSNGQLVAPSYVIRLVGLMSALRMHEGHTHLKTALIDEAFTALDEKHSLDILQHLTNNVNLQLIIAMPLKECEYLTPHVTDRYTISKADLINSSIGELETQVIVDKQVLKNSIKKLKKTAEAESELKAIKLFNESDTKSGEINETKLA